MDIADILDPRRELDLAEFTGSSTAGPSGQQPQVAPFYGRLFDQEVARRKNPTTYEVHGMKTAERKEKPDDEEQSGPGRTLTVAAMIKKARKSKKRNLADRRTTTRE